MMIIITNDHSPALDFFLPYLELLEVALELRELILRLRDRHRLGRNVFL